LHLGQLFLDRTQGWRSAPGLGGIALKRMFHWLGASLTAASLLSGCIDPGPGPAHATTSSQNSTSRTATLSWQAPTTNTDGTPLTDLAGYRIYYGSSPEQLSHTVQINTAGLQTYVVDDLQPGTWYFAVTTVAANGVESTLSDVVATTIS
jgi:hypothetical protein